MQVQVQQQQSENLLPGSSSDDEHMDGMMSPQANTEKKEDANLSVTFNETECSFSTMHSTLLIRDTTDEEGGAGVETSQITVNTHTSILNIDDDEEDGSIIKDDDCSEIPIERSYIFDEGDDSNNDIDFQSVVSEDRQGPQSSSSMCMPQTPEPYQATCDVSTYLGERRESNTEMAVKGGGLFDLVDNLCFRGATPIKDEREAVVVWDQYKQMLEYDILELLGCTNAPDEEEITKVWQNTLIPNPGGNNSFPMDIPDPPRARRRPWQERAVRVHRIRTERLDDNGVVAGSAVPLKHSRSMDDRMWNAKKHQKHDSWTSFQLFADSSESLQPTAVPPKIEEDGYDSDPEEHAVSLIPPLTLKNSSSKSPSVQRKILQPRTENVHCISSITTASPVEAVQETLNMSWSVTWHPGKSESFSEPRNVSIWIERGTLIECNTIMLEPNLMWRETFQPDLKTKRKLNESSQKPHSIRLLNLCRVLDESGLDRSRFPLVRPPHAFIIKTSDGQEFLFEAKNQTERDDLVRRWKLTTARFATLAVLEDIETICKEFFSPTVTSRMLVPNYDKPEESTC